MARSGDHRIRHLARWVATPVLVVATSLVSFAAYERDVTLLLAAAVGALVAGVAAVVVFDVELIRSRRAHGADRVAQARAYASMYAAHVRVMAEGFALAHNRRDPVAETAKARMDIRDARPEPAVRDSVPKVATADAAASPAAEKVGSATLVAATVTVSSSRTVTSTRTVAGEGAKAPAAAAGAQPTDARLTDAKPTDAKPTDAKPTDTRPSDAKPPSTELAVLESKAVAVPAASSATTGPAADAPAAAASDRAAGPSGEEWDGFREAPTVVDLMAWEVRARVAAEDERDRKARSDVEAVDDAAVAADVEAGSTKKRARKGA